MIRTILRGALLVGAMSTAGIAVAAVTLNSVRVGGENVEALGKFYQAAFGLKEVNRLSFPGGVELFLNFGDSVDAAKANTSAQIVIMHRDSDELADEVPHAAKIIGPMRVPLTFDATIDAANDLPGPGIVSFQGTMQLE